MSAESVTNESPRWMGWAGWIASAVPAAMLTLSAVMKIGFPEKTVEGFTHLGWDVSVALALGVVELLSVILFLLPRTAVLGAILMTGYLGGAIGAHVRIGEYAEIAGPVVFGILAWLGLVLRDERVRSLLPFRR